MTEQSPAPNMMSPDDIELRMLSAAQRLGPRVIGEYEVCKVITRLDVPAYQLAVIVCHKLIRRAAARLNNDPTDPTEDEESLREVLSTARQMVGHTYMRGNITEWDLPTMMMVLRLAMTSDTDEAIRIAKEFANSHHVINTWDITLIGLHLLWTIASWSGPPEILLDAMAVEIMERQLLEGNQP